MTPVTRVDSPPPKPLMVFDGDCNFCRRWISRWQQATGDRVDYLPFQNPDIAERFPEIPRAQFEQAVQLIDPSGDVSSGAEAVFRTLALAPRQGWTLWAYQNVPGIKPIAESWYHFVANHRTAFSKLTRLFWGDRVELPSNVLARWLFLRFLGIIYLIAFVSLWTQIGGLIGHNGIHPAAAMMQMVHTQVAQQGIGFERYHLLPTLCWISASDGFLNFMCASGTILSLLVIAGVAVGQSLLLLWLLYLSLSVVSGVFLNYQWDTLLLEVGMLAVFLSPWQLLPRVSREREPSRIALWLLRALLFKLMFCSGVVKLSSGDVTWRGLTALSHHYETQPLPPWSAWYMNQLPLWFQKSSCAVMFAIELGAPFLIFLPRRLRFAGGGALLTLQLLIMATGNYCFFNLLTIALCILLLDDEAVLSWSRFGSVKRLLFGWWTQQASHRSALTPSRWLAWFLVPFSAMYLLLSTVQVVESFHATVKWPWFVEPIYDAAAPFRSVNGYGLFAVMTIARLEIIVEGSRDGIEWRAYEFKYKPGDLNHRPGFVAPHQPRLDWQMWFAALGNRRSNPWFLNFCQRLLQGSPPVLALLKTNPFPDQPPRYVRATMYDYHFTDFATGREQGAWWQRDHERSYCPPLSLASH